MPVPDHTSASQLSTYASCPRKYAFRYVDHVESEFKSVSLVLGSVFHGAVQWYVERRAEGERPDIEDALLIARADFAAATEVGNLRWGRWTREDLAEHARRLVAFFLRERGDLPVRSTEARFEMDLYDPETGEILPRTYIGFFDLLLDGSVGELKTARSEYTPMQIASNLQLGGYLVAADRHGLGGLDLMVIIKNRQPRLQQLRLKPSPKAESWFLEAACSIERSIAAGHFPPSPGWMCGSCEYQQRCLGQVVDAEAA